MESGRTPPWGGYAGGKYVKGGGIHHPEEEYDRSLHFNMTNYGSMWRGQAAAGVTGIKKVVRTGVVQTFGGAGGRNGSIYGGYRLRRRG